jgi:hypothetical protein
MAKRTETKKAATASPKPEAPASAKPARKPTVSSVARELILAGRTNEEVFAALHAKFKLPESKKHYPAWYRSDLVRREREASGDKAADALKVRLAKTAHPK